MEGQEIKIRCEKCGGEIFQQAVMLKRVSDLLKPTPVQVFACLECNHVNAEFLSKELKPQPEPKQHRRWVRRNRPVGTINWPKTEFTVQDLHRLNPRIVNITLRVRLNKAIEEGLIIESGSRPGGRGRPQKVFVTASAQNANGHQPSMPNGIGI